MTSQPPLARPSLVPGTRAALGPRAGPKNTIIPAFHGQVGAHPAPGNKERYPPFNPIYFYDRL